jgi:hypothetical protein
MKKKVIMALTVLFALCFAITVFALNQSNISARTRVGCCAKKDSCPMKDKQAKSDKTSCCDKDSCCCKGDSCPMKMNGEKMEGKDCCCQGDSCPMKKDSEKQTSSVDIKNVTVVSDDENCCPKGGDCCKGKHS